MREILSRGKRKDNGEWVEGYYVCCHKHNRHFIISFNFFGSSLWFDVVPETVGQLVSGIPDKNGKKIFEGDVLSDANVKGVVFYSDKFACFMLRWKKFYDAKFRECRFTDFALFEYMDVIGNIHDNPELMEDRT